MAETIAAVWCEVLGLEAVADEDHFMLVGGDSLNATRVVARLRDRLAVDLDVEQLFDYPVFRDLVRHVETRRVTD